METSIGFIGAGNMAGAIINGIIKSETQFSVYAYDIDKEKCERFGERVGYVSSIAALVEKCKYIFLAVKPQVVDLVLDELATNQWNGKVIITLVAGLSTKYIEDKINAHASIIRIMPNTPIMLGAGSTTICANNNVDEKDFTIVKDLLSESSFVCAISEEQMNAAITLNGSSPAYLFLFAKAAVDYAKSVNIDEKDALQLFANSMIGSAKMLLDSNMDPDTLIRMVTSPGGTTLEALRVFEGNDFEQIVIDAMNACTRRAGELGK